MSEQAVETALENAIQEAQAAPDTPPDTAPDVAPDAASGQSVARPAAAALKGNLGLLSGVELPVTLCFGRRRMRLRDVLELNAGSVIELDRQVEDPVELLLDGRVIARGEVVVVDGSYGLRVLEVVEGAKQGGKNVQ
jgi:flagellar motor switch protein FliN